MFWKKIPTAFLNYSKSPDFSNKKVRKSGESLIQFDTIQSEKCIEKLQKCHFVV